VENYEINAGVDADRVFVQAQWIPFFDSVHILGRVGYDLVSESADFHFVWHEGSRALMVHPPYRWLQHDSEYEAHQDKFAYLNEEDIGNVPYYRFPRTKDGTTLIEILEVLFARRGGLPKRIVLL
jgi:hypothetical protein